MRRLALVSLICALAFAGSAQAAPTLQEFTPVPTANAGLQDIVQGPDGNMYFTERNANMIGRISGSSPGATTELPLAGGATSPDIIVVGPDNALWWTQSNSVGRMVPGSPAQTFGGLGIISARGIAVGPDGNLWVSDAGGNQVHRITPAGTAASLPIPLPMGVNARGIARGADGNMWVADFSTPGGVVKVTQAGVATRYPVPVGSPIDVIAGSDGNLWYAGQGTAVGKVTPAGTATPFVAKGVDPFGIALGPDGAVWYAEFQGQAVGRVDKAGVTSHITGMTGSAGPRYVAPGPGNTIWFTEETGNRVGRVTGIALPGGGGGGGGGGGTVDQTKPKLSKLKLSTRRVRKGGRIRIRYALSEPGSVTLTVGRCVRAKRSKSKRCVRFKRVKPTIRLSNRKAGQNRLTFTARLRPGAYRLSLSARDKAGNRSKQLSTRITVLPKRKRR